MMPHDAVTDLRDPKGHQQTRLTSRVYAALRLPLRIAETPAEPINANVNKALE